METKSKINYKDFIFLIVFLFAMSMCITMFIKNQSAKKSISKNITYYNNNGKYDFLYFDKNISSSYINLYEEYVDKHDYLADIIKEGKLKIVISNDTAEKTINKLFNTNKKYNENLNGMYYKNYELIVINNKDMENMKIDITDDIRLKADNEEFKEFIKDKTSFIAKEWYSKEEIKSFNDYINGSVFYHELGHFILSKENNRLISKELYKKEKDIIFNTENSKELGIEIYATSSLGEYVAECISNYLNYGYVEYTNLKLEKNTTETGNVIDNFFNELKSKYK